MANTCMPGAAKPYRPGASELENQNGSVVPGCQRREQSVMEF